MTNFVFEKEKTNRMGSANLKPRRGSDTYEQGTPRSHATPIRDAQQEGNRDRAILSIVSLRQQKALHLYHLIREYKLFSWWD